MFSEVHNGDWLRLVVDCAAAAANIVLKYAKGVLGETRTEIGVEWGAMSPAPPLA